MVRLRRVLDEDTVWPKSNCCWGLERCIASPSCDSTGSRQMNFQMTRSLGQRIGAAAMRLADRLNMIGMPRRDLARTAGRMQLLWYFATVCGAVDLFKNALGERLVAYNGG